MPTEQDYIDRTIETVRVHRDSENSWPQWANIFADEIERLRAELQAAQERVLDLEGTLKMEAITGCQCENCLLRREALAAQRAEEPSEQRFTENGAECRNTHVKGYTGPICSCPPLACFAVERTEEPSERHNPWDAACSRHLQGEPTRADARCLICRPEEPSDDEGLEPIETSPLTEREPDL